MTRSASQQSPVIRCFDCGYILNGLDRCCPECGRPFRRDDPATFSRLDSRSRRTALLHALALIGCFCIVIIAGGHGIAPLGMLYLLSVPYLFESGSDPRMLCLVLIGWTGLLAAGLAWAFPSRGQRRLSLSLGAALLAGALLCAWRVSDSPGFTLGTSVPFFFALLRIAWVVTFEWPPD